MDGLAGRILCFRSSQPKNRTPSRSLQKGGKFRSPPSHNSHPRTRQSRSWDTGHVNPSNLDETLSRRRISRREDLDSLEKLYKESIEPTEFFQDNYSEVASYIQALNSSRSAKDAELEGAFNRILESIRTTYPIHVFEGLSTNFTEERLFEFILASFHGHTSAEQKLELAEEQLQVKVQECKTLTQNLGTERIERERNDLQNQRRYEELRDAHIMDLRNREHAHAKALNSQQSKFARDIQGLNARHSQVIDQYKAQVDTLNMRHNHQMEEARIFHASQINDLKADHKGQMVRKEHEWETKKENFEETIKHLQIALLQPAESFRPMTDTECRDKLEDLRQELRAIARSATDHASPEVLGELFGQTALVQYGQRHDWKYIFEGVLWDILMGSLFDHPFKTLGKHGDLLSLTWAQLFDTGSKQTKPRYTWPIATTTSEIWRYNTCEALRNALASPHCDEYIQHSYETHLESTADRLAALVAQISTTIKTSTIDLLVNKASTLALDFSIQRSRLQLFTSYSGEDISASAPDMYQRIGVSNDRPDLSGLVQLAIMPGVKKTGDGKGGSLKQSSVLRPAAVYMKTWP